ncbi:hypothetical protein HMPREF2855_10985 [Staphylococcus sp. HMSC077E11]|nr:hypothetical protein HMPREF2855_10985 [Staphylococcus sp. HMSC077E11]
MKTGAPTNRLSKRKPTDKASWGWGPNKEKCEKHFVKQSKLGWAPTKRISRRNSASTASRPCIASFFHEHKVT